MNTMKRLLLGTSLLLLAGLCVPAVHADPVYSSGVTVISPTNGQSFIAVYPTTSIKVPVSITKQFVDVTGAASSTYISVTYFMADAVMMPDGSSNIVASDYVTGQVMRLTTADGHYHRNLFDGSGDTAGNVLLPAGRSYSVRAASQIQGPTGGGGTTLTVVKFSVDFAV